MDRPRLLLTFLLLSGCYASHGLTSADSVDGSGSGASGSSDSASLAPVPAPPACDGTLRTALLAMATSECSPRCAAAPGNEAFAASMAAHPDDCITLRASSWASAWNVRAERLDTPGLVDCDAVSACVAYIDACLMPQPEPSDLALWPGEEADPCHAILPACPSIAGGFECDLCAGDACGGAATTVIAAAVGEGARCGYPTWTPAEPGVVETFVPCAPELFCSQSDPGTLLAGRCVRPAASGQACGTTQPCAAGLACGDAGRCVSVQLGLDGEPCDYGANGCDEIEGAYCRGGSCLRVSGGPGDACSAGNPCDAGLTCMAGYCASRQPTGGPCVLPLECASGACDRNVCT